MMTPLQPVKIKAPHGARAMNVEWSDGHHGEYPHEILRGYCPCAGCQGHSGSIRYRVGGNLELRDLATVGNYAIRLTWGDGHGTGLYNFEFLRRLCRCPACAPEPAADGSLPDLPRS